MKSIDIYKQSLPRTRWSKRDCSKIILRGHNIGWDLLNDGRQVVAPPSIDINTKKKYKWIVSPSTTPCAIMPKWLEAYLTWAKSF